VKIPSHFPTPSHFLSRYIDILQPLPITFSGEINRYIYTHRNEQLKKVPFRVRRAAAGGGPNCQREYKNDTKEQNKEKIHGNSWRPLSVLPVDADCSVPFEGEAGCEYYRRVLGLD